MPATITPEAGLALFGVMLTLAMLPGVSVLIVSTRSATGGFMHGAAATAGIVAGDMIFILLAIAGLTFLAEWLGHAFVYIHVLGGIYLVWLGIQTIVAIPAGQSATGTETSRFSSSFMAGLSITLGDQKAILFYLGFLPAFVELAALTIIDVTIILLIAMVSIGSAKLGYACFAAKSRLLLHSEWQRRLSMTAGCLMLGVGLYLIYMA